MTREEVIISLGVNNASIQSGLTSATQKIDLWAKQQTSRFSAAFRDAKLTSDHGLDVHNEEKRRMAEVEEASRRNQARRLWRVREENRARKQAHLEELARKAKEDLAAEQSIKKRMAFLRAATKLGGAMVAINAVQIADGVVESIGNSFRRFGDIFRDWREIARLGTGGGGLGSGARKESAEIARIEKLREANQKRHAEEKAHAVAMSELYAQLAASTEALSKAQKERDFGQLHTSEEKLKVLEAERKQIKDNIEANKDELSILDSKDVAFGKTEERDKLRLGFENSLNVLKKRLLETETSITEEREKQFDLTRTTASALKQLQNYQRGEAQYTTVEELAMNRWSQFQDEAQEIQRLERYAKYNRSGFWDSDVELAKRQESRIVGIKEYLAGQGAIAENPIVSELKSIGVILETEGIKVKGTN